MLKKILVLSGKEKISPLLKYFSKITADKAEMIFYSCDFPVNVPDEQKNISIKNKKNFNLESTNKIKQYFILFFLPLIRFKYLLFLLFYKYRKKYSTIILFSWTEKIILTSLAKKMNLTCFWIFTPKKETPKLIKPFWRIIIKQINKTKIISIGANPKNISALKNINLDFFNSLPVAIKTNTAIYQGNIFDNIAQKNSLKQKKFFTVGTVVDLDNSQDVETLLKAAKRCLSAVPNLQIIIVGEGKERKKLTWLAKKLEIDSLTWFVGKQNNLKKWFDSFDIFLSAAKITDLASAQLLLKAALAGLPVIAPRNNSFSELIRENINGILYADNNTDGLAECIIRLFQSKNLRKNLGQNAAKQVLNKHNINNIADKMADIILR